MSKETNWKIEADNISMIVWRNTVDTSLTIEVHRLEENELDYVEETIYYVFPAKNGKGIPSSPTCFTEKKEAVKYAKSLMEV